MDARQTISARQDILSADDDLAQFAIIGAQGIFQQLFADEDSSFIWKRIIQGCSAYWQDPSAILTLLQPANGKIVQYVTYGRPGRKPRYKMQVLESTEVVSCSDYGNLPIAQCWALVSSQMRKAVSFLEIIRTLRADILNENHNQHALAYANTLRAPSHASNRDWVDLTELAYEFQPGSLKSYEIQEVCTRIFI